METKTCPDCGRNLPVEKFKKSRWGGYVRLCNDCIAAKQRETREYNHPKPDGGGIYTDPDFDGKSPGDVWRMMCRAKRWLEARNFKITLDGEYREVLLRKLKYQ